MKALRIFAKIIVVLIPVILLWIYIAVFPVCYMDGEYSYFTQAKDYRLGKTQLDPCSILILGDSRAKSALLPEELPETSFSLAEGGTTSVEAYFTLKDYLEHMGTPDAVILSVSSFHFTSFDGFWSRSIYFDYLSSAQAQEVLAAAGQFQETDALEAAGGADVFTLMEYKIKSPTKYMTPVVNSIGQDRKTVNEEAYEVMVREKGYKSFVSWWPVSGEYDMESFELLSTLDYFYRKTLDLCAENGIEVYSVNTPLIEDTYEECRKIWEPFSAYFEKLKNDYPESRYPTVHIETDFEAYENGYFDDADHLNRKGAETYTRWLVQEYFSEAQEEPSNAKALQEGGAS